MISGWISYAITALIGLSLLGVFGDAKNFTAIYGVILILLFIWFSLRRAGVIPAF